jgi:hypothetical protein
MEFDAAVEHVRNLRVPLQFLLEENQVASTAKPDPIFMMAPRCTYLPIFASEIVEYYRQFAGDFDNDDPCFTTSSGISFQGYIYHFQDNALKLLIVFSPSPCYRYLPVGVLYDLHNSSTQKSSASSFDPMIIVVRFHESAERTKYCISAQKIKGSFFHNIKQSNHVLFGNLSRYNGLSVKQQDSLWQQAQMGGSVVASGSRLFLDIDGLVTLKNIPVRILILSSTSMAAAVSPVTVIQKSVQFDVASKASIEKVIRDNIPVLQCETISSLITHGVDIPLSASLYDIWRLFRSSDLFLYIVVVK